MRRNIRRSIRIAFWLSTPLTILITAIEYMPRLPSWTSKMPEWVGAIGAIAAFAGTIVIASNEAWRRHRAEKSMALLAGAAILDRVREYLSTIDILCSVFQPDTEGMSRETLDGYRGKLLEEQMWEREEIMPLVVLPDEVAPRLQRVAARHYRLMKNIEHLKFVTWPSSVTRIHGMVCRDLLKTRDDLIRCTEEIEYLLRGLYKDDDRMS
jgi:hypothetical protein